MTGPVFFIAVRITALVIGSHEGDEESRVLYNNGDGTWIDENGNLHEE